MIVESQGTCEMIKYRGLSAGFIVLVMSCQAK